MDPLPPLNWIRAFEAAARHESFRRAAGELRVSPGAVSQKVKALESLLGVTLFERHPRGVQLTKKGRRFRDDLCPALDDIAATTRRIAEKTGGERLRIVALPADLLGCQLLYDTQWAQDWALWFQAAGLPSDSGQRESGFILYSMAIEAASEGLGVAIGHESLVARELACGRLMAPFDVPMPVPHGYAAIVPRWSNGRTDVGEFVDWLTSECTDLEKAARWKRERLADASHDLST